MNVFPKKYHLLWILVFIGFCGCRYSGDHELKLFTALDSTQTKISFINWVHDQADFNIINYLYFYDGGGVAIGDINNDGLDDIYFTSNLHRNRLYLNEGNLRFKDITRSAGVGGGTSGWTTGVSMVDVNGDGWPDIYISNDFQENDYLYINNGDGSFSEQLQELVGHTSRASMGNDIADFNGDARPDILTLDMRSEDESVYKRSGGDDSYTVAQMKKGLGYAPQLSRNAIQLNRGNGDQGYPLFSDIGAMLGVDATDWSWAGLFCDLNLNGRKDLFITNGIYRRPNDLDYLVYTFQSEVEDMLRKGSPDEIFSIIQRLPSKRATNYAYANTGDLSFRDRAQAWGLGQPGFSNGAAYGDLDNDGDLDLVVNNVNMPAFVYRNNADSLTSHHYLKVELKGSGRNTRGIGASVILSSAGKTWYRMQAPVRGFQSSVSPVLNFGLGDVRNVDSLVVLWPDDSKQLFKNVHADQQLTLKQEDATGHYAYNRKSSNHTLFKDVSDQFIIPYRHREDTFNEFERQPLIPHMLSTEGPALAAGDVNGDGLDDFFVGGAHNQAGQLYIQTTKGRFKKAKTEALGIDKASEDVAAAFFDTDGDGDLDLYVVSGGDEFPPGDPRYDDRLYMNDGHSGFTKGVNKLPLFSTNGSCVAPVDFDGDGDEDLFVGSRSVPFNYGKTPHSYLLENAGDGTFTNVTHSIAAGLAKIGMVTDATWADVDGDKKLDLVVVGEYMPVTIYRNVGSHFTNYTQKAGLQHSKGWWNTVLAADFDSDGDIDLAAGNLGTNTVLKASPEQPLKLYLNDFDSNGISDPIITIVKKEKRYPIARLGVLRNQLPGIPRKFFSYSDFSSKSIFEIFRKKKLRNADIKQVNTFRSSYFKNRGKGTFTARSLPTQVQFSPVKAMLSRDFNSDGNSDILLVGNFHAVKPSEGRYDASYGCLLLGSRTGRFQVLPIGKSGFIDSGQGRALQEISAPKAKSLILLARNNRSLQIFKIASKP